MAIDETQIGRLAMRVEGDNWVAYYAKRGTMDGAVWLGSIRMGVVQNLDRKEAFMLLMQEVVADLLEDVLGVRPIWPNLPVAAPEHERAGNG